MTVIHEGERHRIARVATRRTRSASSGSTTVGFKVKAEAGNQVFRFQALWLDSSRSSTQSCGCWMQDFLPDGSVSGMGMPVMKQFVRKNQHVSQV